eukprot:CAMPEP_0176484622 /NCGR_PEP_ID=MMETSP0200_2-20121128/4556_1 /TAXON_ID=947934 /ORGANISM="Chaetoceros sp., Strain GSL56" /LENGTH=343 /DNA_ID=CAMNT_0017881115 /DNA_START=210 /DNA_END=1238 /DNA_ORIENTATION=+
MSKELKQTRSQVKLIASVLESEREHNQVYKDSMKNIEQIRQNGHDVMFEVDATKLQDSFAGRRNDIMLDRIQWNFPHWRGKTNHRRNRKLLSDFFSSSKNLLSSGGQVHVALRNHQGGMKATTNTEWRGSWLPAVYAGENGFLQSHLLPYRPEYKLSAYQFRDRPFFAQKESYMHIFTKIGNGCLEDDGEGGRWMEAVPKDIQMYSYFTLFISLPIAANDMEKYSERHCSCSNGTVSGDLWSNQYILDTNFVLDMIQRKVPDGIRAEIKQWRVLREKDSTKELQFGKWKVVEYQVVVFGETIPLTMEYVERYKNMIEDEVDRNTVGTRRGAWNASHVLPVSIL